MRSTGTGVIETLVFGCPSHPMMVVPAGMSMVKSGISGGAMTVCAPGVIGK